jgi:CBS domain-containing protein
MLQNNVASVLITDNQKPFGMISDKDILRDIVVEHKDPKKTLTKDLNYTPLILLQGDESMLTAMKFMGEKGIKRAAMVKNGQLIGMLTEDIAKKTALKVKAPAP